MAQVFHPSMNVVSRASIAAVALGLPVLGILGWGISQSYGNEMHTPREQPIPFSHKHHVGDDGIDCRYCHSTVDKGASAGMPSTYTCMTCHSQIWSESPLLEPLREAFREGKAVQWQRVHDLPDFAYFNHSIHVKKGVSCVSCHGRVDEMALVWKEKSLNMAFCIDCHKDPKPNLRPREHVTDLAWKPKPEDAEKMGSELFEKYHVLGRTQLTNCSTCHR
jgi:hypothetical protein